MVCIGTLLYFKIGLLMLKRRLLSRNSTSIAPDLVLAPNMKIVQFEPLFVSKCFGGTDRNSATEARRRMREWARWEGWTPEEEGRAASV
jgi:hypothetical protein